MKRPMPVTCLFLDVGGVVLTDGWGREFRARAAKTFGLNLEELENRHHLVCDAYELGKIVLEDYLSSVVFYEKRKFTRGQFRAFMFAQSAPFPQMIALIRTLKSTYGLKTVVLSNEARELNAHRIGKYQLAGFVDAFVSSCFVHLRKPDADIYRLALDLAQVPASQVLYLENTPMFVEVAEGLGIRSILHTSYDSTRAKMAGLGFPTDEVVARRRWGDIPHSKRS